MPDWFNGKKRLAKRAKALHDAIQSGTVSIAQVQKLLQWRCRRAMVEATDGLEWTALHMACRYANLELVQYLVEECGANIIAKNKYEWTPLHCACYRDKLDVVQYLVETCKFPFSYWGETALHAACYHDNLETVRYLVQVRRLDLEAVYDRHGGTPLHTACRHGNVALVRYLVETLGANSMALTNRTELTPCDVARIAGHVDIVAYLDQRHSRARDGLNAAVKAASPRWMANYGEYFGTIDLPFLAGSMDITISDTSMGVPLVGNVGPDGPTSYLTEGDCIVAVDEVVTVNMSSSELEFCLRTAGGRKRITLTVLHQLHPWLCLDFFSVLCGELQRNDPKTTRVCVDRIVFSRRGCTNFKRPYDAPFGYGVRLADALQHNTVVTEIDLQMGQFLSIEEQQEAQNESMTDDAVVAKIRAMKAGLVLDWIQQSSSLQKITLMPSARSDLRVNECLVLAMLNAAAPNPSVRELQSYIPSIDAFFWTRFLIANSALTSLRIEVDWDDSETSEIEQAAQAMAAHPGLEEVALGLKSDSVLFFFRSLQSHGKLRHFTVESVPADWGESISAQVGQSLYRLLSTCSALKHLTIRRCSLHTIDVVDQQIGNGLWSYITTGLRSSPSISHLSLQECNWDVASTAQLVDPEQFHQTLHHVRHLSLSDNVFRFAAGQTTTVGNALAFVTASSGCPLRHLDMSDHAFRTREFFASLTSSNRTQEIVGLETLTIRHARYPRVLRDLADFLPTSTRLLRLRIVLSDIDSRKPGLDIALPAKFRRALLRNGSLHHLDIENASLQAFPMKSDSRLIQAVTMRNQVLPVLLQASTMKTISDGGVAATKQPPTCAGTSRLLYPELYNASHRAIRMAPKNVLIGLLATTDTNAARQARLEAPATAGRRDEYSQCEI